MSSTRIMDEGDENHDVPKTCIIKFTAVWCGPCQNPKLKETLNRFKQKYNVIVKEIDVDEFPELANRYSCSSIPLFVAVKDDRECERCTGLSSKLETLFEMIQSEKTENAEFTNESSKDERIDNTKTNNNQIVLPILKKAELKNDTDNDN